MKRVPIEKILLGVVAVGGVMALALVAPGLTYALRPLGFTKRHSYTRQYANNALRRLEEKGCIVYSEKNGMRFVTLTARGRKRLNQYRLKDQHDIPKQWDKHWRIVMFDIPERRRAVRRQIRDELRNFGFVRLQDSVWVYPYPCEEFIKLMKADAEVGKYVWYLVAKYVEYPRDLEKIFKLDT